MTKSRVGVYPGTFDPITLGHYDIVRRALTVVDRLVIAIASNDGKSPLFPLEERLAMTRADLADLGAGPDRLEVRGFDNLLMHFANEMGASVIVRGLRAVSDFEYEFQMAGMNTRLDANVETVFLMASEHHQFISSRFVKEITRLGGDVSSFVSPAVVHRLAERFGRVAGDGVA